jgi:hypothetical protein
MLNNVYLIVLLFTFLSSLNAFRLDMVKPYKWFSLYLLFALLAEWCAVMWPRLVRHYDLPYSRENHWIYNLYLLPAYLFYLLFYYSFLKGVQIKMMIKTAAVLFTCWFAYDLFFVQGMFRLNTYTVIVAGIMVVALSLAYFYQVLRAAVFLPIHRDPLFWISAGTFLFHLTTMLGLFFIVFLNDWYGKAAFTTSLIIKITSIVMYLAYSIAFLCQRKV